MNRTEWNFGAKKDRDEQCLSDEPVSVASEDLFYSTGLYLNFGCGIEIHTHENVQRSRCRSGDGAVGTKTVHLVRPRLKAPDE